MYLQSLHDLVFCFTTIFSVFVQHKTFRKHFELNFRLILWDLGNIIDFIGYTKMRKLFYTIGGQKCQDNSETQD